MTVILSTHPRPWRSGAFTVPSLWMLLSTSSLGDPFILLAGADIPDLPTGAMTEDTVEASKDPHPLAWTRGHRRSDPRRAGKTKGGGAGRRPGTSLGTDSTCLMLCHCPLEAGAWLDLPGSVPRTAVACHGGGNLYNKPGKVY